MPTTNDLRDTGLTPVHVNPEVTAGELYESLRPFRNLYLERAREAAKVTLPFLVPDSGANGSTTYPTPESSFGASAVNNLAAKITSVMLPPDSPFFIVEIDRPDGLDDQTWAQVNLESRKSLSVIEQKVMDAVDTRMLRSDTIEAIKHLLVAGNVCLKLTKGSNDRAILYPLSAYVCQRDPRGHLIHLVLAETIPAAALSEDIRVACGIPAGTQEDQTIYTRVSLNTRETDKSPYSYVEYKELNSCEIPDSRHTYKDEKKLPYLCLRYEVISGESYGRGLVEQYQGDFLYLNQVSGAIKDAAVIASQVRWLVNPNGNTDIRALQNSVTGQFVSGTVRDVEPLRLDKNSDMQFADMSLRTVEQRLSAAFLLTNSIRRDAERVTAQEISVLKQDLDTSLGGVYSSLAQEFQMPLLENLFESLRVSGDIPGELDVGKNKGVTVRIISGITGLGRGTDLQRYNTFLEMIAKFAPDKFGQALRFDALASRVAVSLGLNAQELVKSPEELQAEQLQAQQAQMAQTALSPQMVQAAAQMQQAQNQSQP